MWQLWVYGSYLRPYTHFTWHTAEPSWIPPTFSHISNPDPPTLLRLHRRNDDQLNFKDQIPLQYKNVFLHHRNNKNGFPNTPKRIIISTWRYTFASAMLWKIGLDVCQYNNALVPELPQLCTNPAICCSCTLAYTGYQYTPMLKVRGFNICKPAARISDISTDNRTTVSTALGSNNDQYYQIFCNDLGYFSYIKCRLTGKFDVFLKQLHE